VAVAGPSLADRFNNEPSLGSLPEDEVLDEDDDRDQREILDALSEHPDDIGLHLELVHLYFQRRDVERFETAAEGMYAHVTDPNQPEWREVVLMGEELSPTHPLFGGHAAAPAYDAEAPVGHNAPVEAFDLGTYVTTPEEQARPAARAPHSEYHFNFDLTPVQRNEAQSRPHAPDVFDVDAPESPYQEPATDGGSRFADLLADERAEAPRHEPERSTWSFADESDVEPLAPEARDTHAADADLDRELHDLDGPTLARDEPHVDIRDLDEPRFDAPRLDEPRFDEPRFDEPRFDEPAAHDMEAGLALDGFSDDPVDTKLDLARAYLDMGDAEGARLMLDEVIAEGSQMQKDTARRMLEGLA
jgi:pilus assembly protein FimV